MVQSRHVSSLLVAGLGLALSACGAGTPPPAAQASNWKDVDLCSLVSMKQVQAVGSDLAEAPTRRSDTNSRSCSFNSIDGTHVVKVTLYHPPAALSAVPLMSGKRTVTVDGRTAQAMEDGGGLCTVRVPFQDQVYLTVSIHPSPTKSTVSPDDESTASCDSQVSLIDAIMKSVPIK
ncbi:DUF3558 domain-containing protein [Rhodococcus sp. D2-41]|uniref:DUF3558 family protein n=1 Tax=Speluncibacter jeojiensis TaxID=2710754 RepID=UPI0024103E34|nr:DUF3558 family protein [Rhodococcus sp. D2-41]MDG3012642.1 DUF3558 domain-containing protein [Rhodococcus sp. D2-41]